MFRNGLIMMKAFSEGTAIDEKVIIIVTAVILVAAVGVSVPFIMV